MTPEQRAAALRLADALDQLPLLPWCQPAEAAALLRELAAEPMQEPVCWGWRVPGGRITMIFSERKDNPDVEVVALYAAPQQRKPLDLAMINRITYSIDEDRPATGQELVAFARAVEKAHGIGEAA